MTTIVRELLTRVSDEFQVQLVAGLSGVDNEVRSITVMEAPDFPQWVSGGEFVLTTFYSIKDEVNLQIQTLRDLASNGVAGLAIKVQRYIPTLDPRLLEIADQLGFPLCTIARDTKFRNLIYSINTLLVNRRTYLLEELDTLKNRLVRCLNTNSINEVCVEMSNAFGCYSLVMNSHREVMSSCMSDNLSDYMKEINDFLDELLAVPNQMEIQNEKFAVIITRHKHRAVGFLIFLKNSIWTDRETALAHQAGDIVALMLLEEYLQSDVENRLVRTYLHKLIIDSPTREELYQQARLLGWGIQKYYVVITSRILDPLVLKSLVFPLFLKRYEQTIKEMFPFSLTASFHDEIITVVSLNAVNELLIKKFVNTFLNKFFYKTMRPDQASVAVGSIFPDINLVKASYHQTKDLLDNTLVRSNEAHFASDNLLELFLIHSSTTLEVKLMAKKVLSPIINYDSEHNTDLLKTIKVFISEDNVDEAAEKLFIHPNTLRNRLAKIAELTGINPLNVKGRFLYMIPLLASENLSN